MMSGEVVIGAVAHAPKVVRVWDLMREYLRGRGFPMDYVLFSHYEAQTRALLEQRIQVAWHTNLAYARTQEAVGWSARPICMRDSDLGFRTHFVARRDRRVDSLAHLRGSTVALGSADSMQAAILPLLFLRRAGLEPEVDLRLLRFDSDVGKHGDTGISEYQAVDAVGSGAADAGAVSAYTWSKIVDESVLPVSELRVVWTSPGYSHCVLTVLDEFDARLEARLVHLLTTMDPNESLVRELMDVEEFRHWVPGADGAAGYEMVFTALRAMTTSSLLDVGSDQGGVT
jgi:ABC-type phosphate/phosphonate transport system substrate-binding protein